MKAHLGMMKCDLPQHTICHYLPCHPKNHPDMNKQYLKWARDLAKEPFFVEFGAGNFRYHRENFLKGLTPSESAFMCLPW